MANKFDLNLLRILCALVENKNVTETALRLDMGISSVSYSLNKLRAYYADPIMIRTKNGMQPTLLAIDLYKTFSPALKLIEPASLAIAVEREKRIYHIRANSIIESWLSWEIINSGTDNSTNIEYEFNNFSYDGQARTEALRSKQIDIDIGSSLEIDSSIAQYQFILKGAQVVCRIDHPRLNDSLTYDMLQKERILTWTPGRDKADIDKYLVYFEGINYLSRSLRLSSFDTMLMLVSHSDAICFIPTPLIPFYSSMYNIKVLDTDLLKKQHFPMNVNILNTSRNDPILRKIIDKLSTLSE